MFCVGFCEFIDIIIDYTKYNIIYNADTIRYNVFGNDKHNYDVKLLPNCNYVPLSYFVFNHIQLEVCLRMQTVI